MKLKTFEAFTNENSPTWANYDGSPSDFLEEVHRILDNILTKSLHTTKIENGKVYVLDTYDENKWLTATIHRIEFFNGRTTKTIKSLNSEDDAGTVARELKSFAENYLM